MIAGRLRWRELGAKAGGKLVLAVLEFPHGAIHFTEAGSKRRASMHLVAGSDRLREFDRGGLEVLEADQADFSERLTSENHTLKRTLTDPRLFSGIGNAYSDEILHRARLSPLALTSRLTAEEIATLYQATRATLQDWIDRLSRETGEAFPEKVLFGTDLFPGEGAYDWEEIGWQTAETGREGLGIALTGMMQDGEISRARAVEIARLVLRENALKLYGWSDERPK